MKQSLLIALFFACSSFTFGQTKQNPELENDLYYKALTAYLKKRTEAYGKIDVIMRENFELTRSFPTLIGDVQINYLNDQGLAQEYKKRGKKILVFEIHPMKTEDSKIVVGFSESLFSRKKRGFVYELSDGCHSLKQTKVCLTFCHSSNSNLL